MFPTFAKDGSDRVIPLFAVSKEGLKQRLDQLSGPARTWTEASGFAAGPGECLAVPDPEGRVGLALVGLGDAAGAARHRFLVGRGASSLPAGTYKLSGGGLGQDHLAEAALGWLLESYRYTRYKAGKAPGARLLAPEGVDAGRIEAIAAGECLTRDLINTPAADMGPAELEAAARDLAKEMGAKVEVIAGDELLAQNFPMIHAVGRAATPARAPRLIDLRWGAWGRKITLVGKGVCFDTGGLDIKPAASMGLMKKDMGGAATVLGLARMIMTLGLPMRLRVLIPAVENAIAGESFRPQDVLTSRKGLTVEVNNTDAEGRLVLADALALASEEDPDLLVSMATLTGAARVAVGPDLAPFFTDDEATAAALSRAGSQVADPVWRMPFHAPYEKMIEPVIADLDNAPSGGMAGAITAALFLRRFAEAQRYVHFDIYGWVPAAAPGRPKGGAGQGARALLAALPEIVKL
ncbi:leucyl aminopeptidase family protein [Wenxinia marina]|uniref:Leucyl aminopeptidase n=1 Tax=Wenxinia marina DSM 24838 TaxID=1123501 RepID=A0A0D0NP04_9RHOB|nr:leucyl aminopeptidase family protein [Wenxinia marina]KIQ70020.1 Leucyl aminopeptidase [Wenxinia marina DSM 24838]GGL62904.1 leucyl aminopeptidase [Wenxinia marina]